MHSHTRSGFRFDLAPSRRWTGPGGGPHDAGDAAISQGLEMLILPFAFGV